MIIISLGANLSGPYGEPRETLDAVPASLERYGVCVKALSQQWLTAPVPLTADPWYYNAAAIIETELSPKSLIEVLKQVEKELGRKDFSQNAPRALDLDLITYQDVLLSTPELCLPHPRLHERAFVLYPLREIAPQWKHPVSGLSVEEMIALVPAGQEIRLARAAA